MTYKQKKEVTLTAFDSLRRCILFCQSNGQVKYEAACLMVLLLFDEVAVTLVDSTYHGVPFSLPKAIVRRYVIRSLIIVICQV